MNNAILNQRLYTRLHHSRRGSHGLVEVRSMRYGAERRKRLLDHLDQGHLVMLDYSFGGGWSRKDKDVQRLIKQGRIKTYRGPIETVMNARFTYMYTKIIPLKSKSNTG